MQWLKHPISVRLESECRRWDRHKIAMITRFLLLAGLLTGGRTTPIDNEVTASEVQCSADAINVSFKTRNDFSGRIFVKGMVESPACVQSYSEDSSPTMEPSMSFAFGDCRMKRARTRGMMQSLVVIISFHPMFVTKVDRAYRVQCFYMEAEKAVTSNFEVSMLTTEDLRDTGAMPTCTYSVHKGSPDGDVVRFATVGEEVYHKWVCDSDSHRMLVKGCYVDDGQANRYDLIDERGCSVDKVIMGELEYGSSDSSVAMVSVEAHVFKFADKPTVFFQPPNCQTRHRTFRLSKRRRHKRNIRELSAVAQLPERGLPSSRANEMDLFSDVISVADLSDAPAAAAAGSARGDDDTLLYERVEEDHFSDRPDIVSNQEGVCLSPAGLGVLLTLVCGVFLLALSITCVLCYQRSSAAPSPASLKPYNIRP